MKSTSACKTNLLNNDNVILRMGGFHIAQTFFGAIGHLMQGTGIVDKNMVQKYMFPSSNNPKVMLVDAMRFIQNYQHHGSTTFH